MIWATVSTQSCFCWLYKPLYSVQFSCSAVSDSLRPQGLQHARLPCPSPFPRACSNSCSSSRWCHPTISLPVVPFSSCLQAFPASECFKMSQFFESGGQSIGVSASASVLPMNIQGWFPLGLTSWISLKFLISLITLLVSQPLFYFMFSNLERTNEIGHSEPLS